MNRVTAFVLAVAAAAQCVEIRGNIRSIHLNRALGLSFKMKNIEINTGSGFVPFDPGNASHQMKGILTSNVNFVYGLGDGTGNLNDQAKKVSYSIIQAAASSGAKVNLSIDPATKCENVYSTCDLSGVGANGVIVDY